MTTRLRVQNLCKSYNSPVLRSVDLTVQVGEIHALLGANGAGKSTLSRIIAGLVPPDSGCMTMDGVAYAPATKADAERRCVQIVQQELNLVDSLSVAENLFLNRLPNRFGFVSRQRLNDLARIALDSVGLTEIDPQIRAGTLGVGVCQLIEIASAISRDCRILILDEPTAALSASETDRLFSRLRAMKAGGVSMIYISHRLDEIACVCDRLTVLRDGVVIGTAEVAQTSSAQMVTMMTGEEPMHAGEYRSYRQSAVALRVNHLHRAPLVRDASLELRRGERLGITGLVGSGRSELLRAIFGADCSEAGTVSVGSDTAMPSRFTHPKQAVRSGMAMVTEDRKRDGLLLTQSVCINITLASLARFATAGILCLGAERTACTSLAVDLATKCESIDQPVNELSGGNQQKVVLGKWILRDAAVLLLDEPTRGIDIASRQRIHRTIEAQAATGTAIVIVSSDLQELMDHCDAIAVMACGRIVARFERGEWSVAAITAASFTHPAAITV